MLESKKYSVLHAAKLAVFMSALVAQGVKSDLLVIDSDEVDVSALAVSPEGGLAFAPRLAGSDTERLRMDEPAQLSENGYIDKQGQASRITQYIEYLTSVLALPENRAYTVRELEQASAGGQREDAIYRLSDGKKVNTGTGQLPFGPVGAEYKNGDNVGHVIVSGGRISQLHSSTKFGALLLEEFVASEENAMDAWIVDPNIEILGNPGKIVHVRYGDDEWSTVLFLPNDNHIVMLECDTKLTGIDLGEFVRLAEDLVVFGR